tara:strand:+ start:3093 stop:4781 length:1689 start_codon:yes stop_codon:yes gene_type:complete
MFLLKDLLFISPYYLSISCIFSVIERTLKTVFLIKTVDKMLLTKSSLSYTDIMYALYCIGILSIRYFFAANRHIYAFNAGLKTRNYVLKYYHSKWLLEPLKKNLEYQILLKNISNNIRELVRSLSTDLIPGIISFFIGCYTIFNILDFTIAIYSIIYIFLIEYLHFIISKETMVRENKLFQIESHISAKVFYLASGSLENKETVNIFDRINHEINRYVLTFDYLLKKEMELIKLKNYQNSFLHWLIHLINGGILWICKGHLEDNSKLIILLFNVNEIRKGIQEFITFNKNKYSTFNLLQTLDKQSIIKEISINKNNYIKTDNKVILKNISFNFGDKNIYNNLSYKFESGSITALLGVNGSGKTTLFRILLREHIISDGILYLPNKKNILLCEQQPQLFCEESVAYNIAYGNSSILNYDTKFIERKNNSFKSYGVYVEKAVKMLNIEYLEDSSIYTLSGGEKQKISLARVLSKALQYPKDVNLLLLDEWDSALDYKSRKLAYQAIQFIRKITNCTIIFITHTDVSKDYTLDFHRECNAIILNNRKITHSGKFKEIWKKYIENI